MERIKNKTVPLFCWDICAISQFDNIDTSTVHMDVSALKDFQRRFGWRIELDSVLSNPYEALLLTDRHQIIRWANKGFQKMTGYPMEGIIGESPRFLQGQQATNEARGRIKQKLQQSVEFEETIENYRKNGEKYICQLHIFPIADKHQQLSHFLALENEIK